MLSLWASNLRTVTRELAQGGSAGGHALAQLAVQARVEVSSSLLLTRGRQLQNLNLVLTVLSGFEVEKPLGGASVGLGSGSLARIALASKTAGEQKQLLFGFGVSRFAVGESHTVPRVEVVHSVGNAELAQLTLPAARVRLPFDQAGQGLKAQFLRKLWVPVVYVLLLTLHPVFVNTSGPVTDGALPFVSLGTALVGDLRVRGNLGGVLGILVQQVVEVVRDGASS